MNNLSFWSGRSRRECDFQVAANVRRRAEYPSNRCARLGDSAAHFPSRAQNVSSFDLAYFLEVAKHRSFRGAGAELGISASALSHALRGLEERLGVRLLNRTSRSVTLKAAGEELQTAILKPFDDIGQGSVVASSSTRGVICQDKPHLSLHHPHALSAPPLPTMAFQ
jgi:hypothetical protein